jgi:acetolactate synthase-1/2/3 large subunit
MTDRARTVAELIVDFLLARGIDRVFGLQGGHIQPIWDQLGQRGVRIVDVRDEGAAVHMAHAHAVLTGSVGIAMVTAGPGVTNCVTAVANAQLERVPVMLFGGCAPRAQDDLGPLQGIAHVDVMRPVTRASRTLRVADNVLRDLDKAFATAAGDGNPPGPVYVEIPTDVLRETVPPKLVLPEWLVAKPPRHIPPDLADVERAARIIGQARRPLVLSGRGALGARTELMQFLDRTGAVYIDTQESRNLVPAEHPSIVGAVRAKAMQEADVVIVVGRKLDYQTAYGSPVAFPNARFIRIGDNWEELRENRRGEVELFAYPALALAALAQAIPGRSPQLDSAWTAQLRAEHTRAREIRGIARKRATGEGRAHASQPDLRGAARSTPA